MCQRRGHGCWCFPPPARGATAAWAHRHCDIIVIGLQSARDIPMQTIYPIPIEAEK